MDLIKIQGLTLYTLIGVYDFERHAKQRILLDVVMHTDLNKAAKSDKVADTLHYGLVAERLAQIAENATYELLESLADEMLRTILSEFGASKVELSIGKPDILDNAENVIICMTREPHHYA